MRAPGYPVLFVGSFLVGAPAPALAVMHVECGVATTCVTDEPHSRPWQGPMPQRSAALIWLGPRPSPAS